MHIKCEGYTVISYVGNRFPKMSIYISKIKKMESECYVANIISDENNEISITDYNNILNLYYNDIIINNVKLLNVCNVVAPTKDFYSVYDVLDNKSIDILRQIYSLGIQNTKSNVKLISLWIEFIVVNYKSGKKLYSNEFKNILMDYNEWGVAQEVIIDNKSLIVELSIIYKRYYKLLNEEFKKMRKKNRYIKETFFYQKMNHKFWFRSQSINTINLIFFDAEFEKEFYQNLKLNNRSTKRFAISPCILNPRKISYFYKNKNRQCNYKNDISINPLGKVEGKCNDQTNTFNC